jgi:argininosuccinate lyase
MIRLERQAQPVRETGGRLLSVQELAGQHELLGAHAEDYRRVLAETSWLESKVSEGGTALARVREQLALARDVLGESATR